jgi:hypothetical protein
MYKLIIDGHTVVDENDVTIKFWTLDEIGRLLLEHPALNKISYVIIGPCYMVDELPLYWQWRIFMRQLWLMLGGK